MLTFLHGSIRFTHKEDAAPGWFFDLDGTFDDGIGPDVPVAALERLQNRQRGDLEIFRAPDGGIRMRKTVVAHGPESARKHAEKLRADVLLFLGFRTYVGSSTA